MSSDKRGSSGGSEAHARAGPSSVLRDFALDVVQQLRTAGFQAVWVGGCVRDQLLDLEPQDYDVATNATPQQVQDVFGKRCTRAIGAVFGVVVVFGRQRQIQVEVATFRRDASYTDGRRPDSVSYSTDREDAQRRDFTINGLFYDPISNQLIDYVGGEADLRQRVIRAIGEPQDRFREDKLRMLRAVRFAATFGFALDPHTLAAVQEHASDLRQVSAERIAAELRRMLADRHRRVAVELLRESRLLTEILPELEPLDDGSWQLLLRTLDRLNLSEQTATWNEADFFVTSMAVLLRTVAGQVPEVCRRLKLSKEEYASIQWLADNVSIIVNAADTSWPQVQRLLIRSLSSQLVTLADATSLAAGQNRSGVRFCQDKLGLSADELNPQPLINGDDLVKHGQRPGRKFKRILEAVRDAQLMGQVRSKQDALQMADRIALEVETRD